MSTALLSCPPWLAGGTAVALFGGIALLLLAHRLRRPVLQSALVLAAGASLLALAAAWLFTFRHQLALG